MAASQRILKSVLIAAVVVFVGLVSLADAQKEKESGKEKRLFKKDLPAAVLSSFQKQYPNAKIKGISMEVEDSTSYYEIASLDGQTRRSLLYTADGQLTEAEEVISAKQLPDSARAEIAKTYPKGKIEAAEKVTKGETTTYEVKIENGKENFELSFDSVGKLLNTEKVTKEEDND